MYLPVLSAACERQGPTWNAIKCPKTIHLVHTYCTHIFVPEYLHWSFRNYPPFDAQWVQYLERDCSRKCGGLLGNRIRNSPALIGEFLHT